MAHRSPRLSPAAFAAALLLLAACSSTMSIGKLLDDPARYDGKQVRIEGRVTRGVGLLGRGAYEVADGTGELPVVSQLVGAPREGARVGVEGIFRSVFTFGDRSGAVLLERSRFDP